MSIWTCGGLGYFLTSVCALIFWCCFIRAVREFITYYKLAKRGNLVHGMVTNMRTVRGKKTDYYIDYQFEAHQGKSKLFIHGYLRQYQHKNTNVELPLSIWEIISSFYGKNTHKTIINDSKQVSLTLFQKTKIKDNIKIKYDPINPKSYNMPSAEYGCGQLLMYSFGCSCFLGVSLLLNTIWCARLTADQFINFLWGLALFCVYTSVFIALAFVLALILFFIMDKCCDEQQFMQTDCQQP